MKTGGSISIKTSVELKVLREAGKILASVLEEIKGSLKTGVTTREIDRRAEDLMKAQKVVPAFKGYRGFPGSICLSVNEQVVHGIPGDRVLKDGDIVSLDVGIVYKGYYADMAVTVGIGTIAPELQRLLDVTYKSLYLGIDQARVNNRLSDISHAIQTYVEANQFSIVREFVGHGIGKHLHEEPEIPNFGPPHQGPVLREGMVLAIEPMVNLGRGPTRILNDGWTVATEDGKPSAHFEHTVAVGRDGPEILTE